MCALNNEPPSRESGKNLYRYLPFRASRGFATRFQGPHRLAYLRTYKTASYAGYTKRRLVLYDSNEYKEQS